jgi:hypothetical protein
MLHNDNYNRREYVVKILLKTVEGLTVDDAVNVMQVSSCLGPVTQCEQVAQRQQLLHCSCCKARCCSVVHQQQLVPATMMQSSDGEADAVFLHVVDCTATAGAAASNTVCWSRKEILHGLPCSW